MSPLLVAGSYKCANTFQEYVYALIPGENKNTFVLHTIRIRMHAYGSLESRNSLSGFDTSSRRFEEKFDYMKLSFSTGLPGFNRLYAYYTQDNTLIAVSNEMSGEKSNFTVTWKDEMVLRWPLKAKMKYTFTLNCMTVNCMHIGFCKIQNLPFLLPSFILILLYSVSVE